MENILSFEKVINFKSYSKNNQTIFIIEIPLVEINAYDYFHLYPLPTPSNNSYKVIIPKSEYLIINEQYYMYSNSRCMEVNPEEFICHENQVIGINKDAPCEIQLLRYSQKGIRCQQIPIRMNYTKILNLENNQWIVVNPFGSVVTKLCKNSRENVFLKGTYVIELISDCQLKINDILLRKSNNRETKFNNLNLPEVKFTSDIKPINKVQFEPTNLKSINFDELTYIRNSLENQKQILKDSTPSSVHFNNISVYTILLYVFLISIGFFMYYYYRAIQKKKEEPETGPIEEITPTPANRQFPFNVVSNSGC